MNIRRKAHSRCCPHRPVVRPALTCDLSAERCNRSRPSCEFTGRGGLEHLNQITTQEEHHDWRKKEAKARCDRDGYRTGDVDRRCEDRSVASARLEGERDAQQETAERPYCERDYHGRP